MQRGHGLGGELVQRFWWVNHNATSRHEVGGGYLWSPKREKVARSQFYENMRLVTPGELVLSYAGQQIRYVGRATDFAFDAPRPKEFGAAGNAWSEAGWLLPMEWQELPTPVLPRGIWTELGPLMPATHSPLVAATGGGAQKAYLAEISAAVIDLILQRAGVDIVSLGLPRTLANADPARQRIEDEQERDVRGDVSIGDTEKQQIIAARRGQGQFKANLCRIELGCRLTGVTESALLIASHIKPWRSCANGGERLDGNNGLLLTPSADRLFDRGFISFTDQGQVLVSKRIGAPVLAQLGFANLETRTVGAFSSAQCLYLEYHRSEILVPES